MRFLAMSRMMDIRLRAGLSVACGTVFAWMLLVSPAVAVGATCAKTETVGTTVKVTCEYTGNEQEFKVPAGVTSVHVVALGGAGGSGLGEPSNPGGTGGLGAVVSGNLSVTAGETLYVEVGGNGGNGVVGALPFPGAAEAKGGFNGGGSGISEMFISGGGGGGASDVRTVSIGAEPSPGGKASLESRLLVAAGGGGGGAGGCLNVNGAAGGNAEEAGQAGTGCAEVGGGGGAGTSTKGGAGGTPGSGERQPGKEGGLGVGGKAPETGGAGGGGLYGGGSGGEAVAPGGGGGGSNLVPAGGTFVGTAKAGEDGSVTLTYTVIPPTTLTTSLSGGGQSGEKITVKEGEGVTDRATLSGENASTATGTATYSVYGDSGCTKLLGTVSSAVSGGKSETSPLTFVEAGTYYWQVSYSGDENNRGSEDTCGAEVLTVTPKPSTCGKTTVGKASSPLEANFKRVNKCALPFNATVSELSIYLTPNSHSGQQLIRGILYADSKGSPAALLGTTIQLTFTGKSKAGWYHLAFPTPLNLTAGNYWIGMITGQSQYVGAEHYDSVTNAQDSNNNSYSAGPSNRFGSFNKGNEQMSLYATFTPVCPAISSSVTVVCD